MSDYIRPVTATCRCRFPLYDLSGHVGHGDISNPQGRINGFMFFSLSALNLEDHLGIVISSQSPLSAGYIILRACRRSLLLRFTIITASRIVGFLILSYLLNISDRLVVHLASLFALNSGHTIGIGNIGHPNLVGLYHSKFTLYTIRGND